MSGVKKLYCLFESWGGIGEGLRLNQYTIDPIDNIFCNDPVAKKIVEYCLPFYPPDQILPIGTPTLQTIEIEKAGEYRQKGREKLSLPEDVLAVLYLGDVNEDYIGRKVVNEDINDDTFRLSLEAVKKLSSKHPDRQMAFLFRPHPRDPQKEKMLQITQENPVDPNLSVLLANDPLLSMQEAAYAADAVMSLTSTENLLAPRRGRWGIYLGYEQAGLGADLLRQSYSPEIIQTIREQPGIIIASSPEELTQIIEGLLFNPQVNLMLLPSSVKINYSKRILDCILAQ